MGRTSKCAFRYAVAKRLNAARKKAGVTYKRIAAETGIPHGTISGYMSGYTSPTPERMQALADAVGMSVDYLMGREEVKA